MKASNLAALITTAVCLTLAAFYFLADNPTPERKPHPGMEYTIKALSEGATLLSFLPTGSMEPTLNENHFAYSRKVPFEDVQKGDIVLFEGPSGATAHRAIRRNRSGDLITKGDANPHKDAEPVTRENYLGTIREEEIFLKP